MIMITAVTSWLQELAIIVQQQLELLRNEDVGPAQLQTLTAKREDCFRRLQESWAAVSEEELSAQMKEDLARIAGQVMTIDAEVRELARRQRDQVLESLRTSHLQREVQGVYAASVTEARGVFVDRRDG